MKLNSYNLKRYTKLKPGISSQQKLQKTQMIQKIQNQLQKQEDGQNQHLDDISNTLIVKSFKDINKQQVTNISRKSEKQSELNKSYDICPFQKSQQKIDVIINIPICQESILSQKPKSKTKKTRQNLNKSIDFLQIEKKVKFKKQTNQQMTEFTNSEVSLPSLTNSIQSIHKHTNSTLSNQSFGNSGQIHAKHNQNSANPLNSSYIKDSASISSLDKSPLNKKYVRFIGQSIPKFNQIKTGKTKNKNRQELQNQLHIQDESMNYAYKQLYQSPREQSPQSCMLIKPQKEKFQTKIIDQRSMTPNLQKNEYIDTSDNSINLSQFQSQYIFVKVPVQDYDSKQKQGNHQDSIQLHPDAGHQAVKNKDERQQDKGLKTSSTYFAKNSPGNQNKIQVTQHEASKQQDKLQSSIRQKQKIVVEKPEKQSECSNKFKIQFQKNLRPLEKVKTKYQKQKLPQNEQNQLENLEKKQEIYQIHLFEAFSNQQEHQTQESEKDPIIVIPQKTKTRDKSSDNKVKPEVDSSENNQIIYSTEESTSSFLIPQNPFTVQQNSSSEEIQKSINKQEIIKTRSNIRQKFKERCRYYSRLYNIALENERLSPKSAVEQTKYKTENQANQSGLQIQNRNSDMGVSVQGQETDQQSKSFINEFVDKNDIKHIQRKNKFFKYQKIDNRSSGFLSIIQSKASEELKEEESQRKRQQSNNAINPSQFGFILNICTNQEKVQHNQKINKQLKINQRIQEQVKNVFYQQNRKILLKWLRKYSKPTIDRLCYDRKVQLKHLMSDRKQLQNEQKLEAQEVQLKLFLVILEDLLENLLLNFKMLPEEIINWMVNYFL